MQETPGYVVVMNAECQYSIWLEELPIPDGWIAQPCRGAKEECLNYIETHWTDMTPASLRAAG